MKKYWIPGPITNYGTTDAGFRGEVRVVLASDHEARLAEVEQDRDKWRERAFNSLRSQEVLRVTDSASVVQYKPCGICTTQSWCETHGCQCYPVSAVQPERCCVDYPRCDCNSPPEPEDAPTLQPCGHPWKAQHDFKCILCSSPGPAHEECLGCSSPTTCEKYGCSVKRQRAIDSASGDRDATSAQSAEEQRFLHGAANGIGPDPLLQEIALRALASGPTITLTLDEVRALYKFLHGTAGTGQSQ